MALGKAPMAPILLKAGPGFEQEHSVCVCVQSCFFGIQIVCDFTPCTMCLYGAD